MYKVKATKTSNGLDSIKRKEFRQLSPKATKPQSHKASVRILIPLVHPSLVRNLL
jgi:hypothetical protein